jgi:hypothetical protein
MKNGNEIILGAGEVFMYEFEGTAIPTNEIIETEEHNVGSCSGGFSIDYKPEKYDVKDQYGKTVKSFTISEEITAKTGILTWTLDRLSLLSTAKIEDKIVEDKKIKTLTFGGGGSLKTVLLRFVHTKPDGNKIRFTMIGQGGNGFAIEFAQKELTVDATIAAISYIKDFLASFEEEFTNDIVGPTVAATLIKLTNTTVELSFSERVAKADAENVANYTLTGTGGLTGSPTLAKLDSGATGTRVTLTVPTVSGFTEGQTLIVTVAGVNDLAGNLLGTPKVATYTATA